MMILKPEPRKFILPTVFLLLFVLAMNTFYDFGTRQDDYACMISDYVKTLELSTDREFCHTGVTAIGYGSVVIEQETEQKFKAAVEMANEAANLDNGEMIRIMTLIDPLLPVPCEYVPTLFCEQYMSATSHNCMIEANMMVGAYRPDSIISIIINGIFLIVEGYLISCLLLAPFEIGKQMAEKRTKNKLVRRTKPNSPSKS